jgi:hypothetical protein
VTFGKFPGFALFPCDERSMQKNVFMERYWNDTDRGKPNFSDRNLSQCQFANQKPDMD